MTMYDILLRLVTALLLSGLIGYERQARSKAAGLRTHILVAMGACLCMMVSLSIPLEMQRTFGIASDGDRIAAQVVSGIGFIGAGSIIAGKGERHIKGLTTAASIWAVAAVGLAAGAGLFFMAAVTTVLILVTLTTVRIIDLRLEAQQRPARLAELTLTVDPAVTSPEALRSFVIRKSVRIRAFTASEEESGERTVTLLIDRKDDDHLAADLLLLPGVRKAAIQKHREP